jgi:hypothetical protein
MLPSLYVLLLSLQEAVANFVTPELRAIEFVVIEKKRGVFLRFFYDSEITEEINDLVSTLTVEVDTYSTELVFLGYEVIHLDSSKPNPIQGDLAFLRYERIMPKFERKNYGFLLKEKDYPQYAIYLLDMQQSLLGRITPALRHVGIDINPERKRLVAHFIYDGEISEFDQQLAISAIEDSRASFFEYEMESFIERIDYPGEMHHYGKFLAYWRQEWIYKDSERIPAIRK